MIFLSIVVFVLMFSLLVFIHELGHFTAAKRAGVKVEEFGFGLPPRLWGKKRGETIYSINWIPFGGFVRMLGEEGGKSSTSKRSFVNQPLRTQAWIASAGVIMNWLLAFVLLTFGFLIGMEPLIATQDDFFDAVRDGVIEVSPVLEEGSEQRVFLPSLTYTEDEASRFSSLLEEGDVLLSVNGDRVLTEADLYAALEQQSQASVMFLRDGAVEEGLVLLNESYPLVSFVEPESPAEAVGLQVGDEIVSINGEAIVSSVDVPDVTQSLGDVDSVEYTVLRNGTEYRFEVERREDGRIGIAVADLLPDYGVLSFYPTYVEHEWLETHKLQYGWTAPWVAVQEMWRLGKATAVMFLEVLGQFLSVQGVPDGVSGPVGIAQMTFFSLQEGFTSVLRLTALLSLSLGVINILPIPALDGGRLLFIVVQALTGKKPDPRIEHWIHSAGFFLLIAFILYITFNDVLKLF